MTTTTNNTIHSKSNFLTEYEKERNARVMRNELLMRRLGLSDFDSHMHNASSSKNKREEEDDSSDEKKKKKKKKKKKETPMKTMTPMKTLNLKADYPSTARDLQNFCRTRKQP